MENNGRTLKELATPDIVYQPWCIQCPPLEPAQSEDPHKHLKEFHVVCSTMRPQGIPDDNVKMKAFSFSLDGAAKDWLYLQPVLFNTWGYEAHVPRKILPSIPNHDHKEGDLWDQATL
ncbi:hypothetical protein CR513_11900, partial [Mucuna pruriens]